MPIPPMIILQYRLHIKCLTIQVLPTGNNYSKYNFGVLIRFKGLQMC